MITSDISSSPSLQKVRNVLYTGGIAAILASACHHISFLLATLGFSETKIVYIVTFTDWARPFLIVVALISLVISYLYIWQNPSSSEKGVEIIAMQIRFTDKAFFALVTMMVLIVLMLPYFAPCTE